MQAWLQQTRGPFCMQGQDVLGHAKKCHTTNHATTSGRVPEPLLSHKPLRSHIRACCEPHTSDTPVLSGLVPRLLFRKSSFELFYVCALRFDLFVCKMQPFKLLLLSLESILYHFHHRLVIEDVAP